jgi:AcrR family transcriptional regulator
MPRPRAFDLDVATERALKLFWSKGYDGTTLEDLTQAMGINRPSLYAAFGNKEGVFRRALERYVSGPAAGAAAALEADTARDVTHRLLRFYADSVAQPDRPRGCFLVQGALACGDDGASIRQALTDQRRLGEEALIRRFERAKREGDLPADVSATDLGRYVWTVCQGIAVQAAGGATRDQLRRVVAQAMRAWPD